MNKFEFKTISIVEKTVQVQQKFVTKEEIIEMINIVASDPHFKGFTKIHFEAGELPTISYFIDLRKTKNDTDDKNTN